MKQDKKYIVKADKIEQFRKSGYALLENIISQEQLKDFRKDMNETVAFISSQGDKQNRIDDYSNIFTQVTNIWKVQPKTQQFILSSYFADIAKQLLGVDHIRLYHDQALIKQPKAGKTPWHQDHFYWPIDSPNCVTMWLPLHNCPRQMGTMKFVTGSHKKFDLQQMPISQESEAYFEAKIKEDNLNIQTFDLNLGDATFHYGRTLHCAHSNGQSIKREVITIIYFEDGAFAIKEENMNEFRRVDLSVFCPGVQCGQKITSELNPLIC